MTIWLQISSGQGPAECQWVVARLADVLEKEAAASGLRFRVLQAESGDEKGCLRSVLASLDGEGHETFAASWIGTVQWIGKSHFRPGHKRKNWFVAVETFQLPEQQTWMGNQVRIETFRASGPGGQHVNKSETAVRAVHESSGLTATAREERSQSANRKLALARLYGMLEDRKNAGEAQSKRQRWKKHQELERGNPVRVFRGDLR